MPLLIILLGIVAQLCAAAVALTLIRKTGRVYAWLVVAAGLIGMAIPRTTTLFRTLFSERFSVPVTAESIALLISILMLAGMWMIRAVVDYLNDLRAQAERELEKRIQTERELRLTQFSLDNATPAVYWLSPEGRFTYANNATCQRLGYSETELKRMSAADINAGEPAESREKYWDNLKNEGSLHYETTHTDRDGTLFPVEVITHHVQFEGEEFEFVFAEDITQRKSAENARRDSDAQLTAIIESVPFVMILVDKDRRVRQINAEGAEFAGRSPEELSGLRAGEALRCIHALDDPRGCGHGASCEACPVRNTVLDTISQQRRYDNVETEMTFSRPEGEVQRTFLFHTTPLEVAGKSMALVVFDNITEWRKTQQGLEQTNKRLEETLQELRNTQHQVIDQERQRALNQMASGIAHDFNNALAPIQGFTKMLLDNPDKMLTDRDKAVEYLRHIRKAAGNATQTIRRMRKFFRPREEDTLTPIDLNTVIKDAVEITKPRWKEEAQAAGQNIEIQTELEDVPYVLGNESEINEVLTNLIFNAVDAMPKGGFITIKTAVQNNKVLMQFTDTGTGMSKETQQKCLDPFFTTKGAGGSGLGLAAVKGIVQRHSGELSVNSSQEGGTRFDIAFPVADAPIEEEQEDARTEKPRALKILVVEDESSQRKLLTEVLTSDGHHVDLASDGMQALRKFNAGWYDLVLTDRSMPEMNGDQLAARIKETTTDKPVIMLTGFGDMMDAADDKPETVDRLISKPVTVTKLREILTDVLT